MGIFDAVFSGDYKASNLDEFLEEPVTSKNTQGPTDSIRIPATLAATPGGYDEEHTLFTVREISTGKTVLSTDQFIVEQCSESRSYRYAPIFTFGQPQVFTPNVRAIRIFQFAGYTLLNHVDGDTRNSLWAQWNDTLRAAKMLTGPDRQKSPYILDVQYRNCLRTGYLTDFQQTPQSNAENQVSLGMTLFVVSEKFL
jgi:hypothetical protein